MRPRKKNKPNFRIDVFFLFRGVCLLKIPPLCRLEFRFVFVILNRILQFSIVKFEKKICCLKFFTNVIESSIQVRMLKTDACSSAGRQRIIE